MDTLNLERIAREVLNYVEFSDFSHLLRKGEIEVAKEALLKAVDRDVSCSRMSSLNGMEIYNQLDLSPERASRFPQRELLLGPAL